MSAGLNNDEAILHQLGYKQVHPRYLVCSFYLVVFTYFLVHVVF